MRPVPRRAALLAPSLFLPLLAAAPLRAQAPVAATPAAAPASPLAGWDTFVEKAREEWRVPGVAMAIVKGNDVLLLKGYGFRDLEKKLPVTPHTLFAIGSATKAFTTFVMGTLADEGKMDWNAPVSRYVPGFRMKDPVASERMTPTDLVTHRSGLPRHDALWYNATLSRKELVARLPYLDPSKDFRTDFQYNNLMFLTAGVLVEQLTGTSWEEAVRTRVFVPLGMTDANFSVLDSQKAPDFALPYEERDDAVRRMEFRNITDVGPAGSINASAADLVPWLKVHLNGGVLDGKRIAGAATVENLHTPRMETGAPQTEPEIVPGGYALGWFTDIYRGIRRVHHGGHIDGFSALVLLVPSEKIGLAVLVNEDGSPLPGLLARHALDRLLGLPPKDWNAERLAKQVQIKAAEREAKSRKAEVRKPGTRPAHPVDEYAGEYENPGYGVLAIARTKDGLAMTYNGITTPLEHWHYETWSGLEVKGEKADNTFENFRITFATDKEGEVSSLSAPMEPAVADVVFARRPDPILTDPAYLARLAGTYRLGPYKVVFTVSGTALAMETDGRRQPDLLPYTNNRFRLKGSSGITIRFVLDAAGYPVEARFEEPEGVYTAKREN
jgi:CubicO group peptidase (beta-lactamase class C family)